MIEEQQAHGWFPLVLLLSALAFPSPAIAQVCTDSAIAAHLNEMVKGGAERDKALDALETCEAEAIPGLTLALSQPNRDIRLEAIAALETLLDSSPATSAWVDGAPTLTNALITHLQTDIDEQVRERAATALGTVAHLSENSARHQAIATALMASLVDVNQPIFVHISAAYALGMVTSEADKTVLALQPLLANSQVDFQLREAAAWALAELNVTEPLVEVLQSQVYPDTLKRSVAIGLKGLEIPTSEVVTVLVELLQADDLALAEDALVALRTIAQNAPKETGTLLLPHLDALAASLARNEAVNFNDTVDLLALASDRIPQANLTQKERAAYLQTLRQGLQVLENNPNATREQQQTLSRAIRSLQAGNPTLERVMGQVIRVSTTTLLLHGLFWLGLVAVYPTSPQVQAIFFWNPKVRKIFGLGYVGLALTWVPFLRAKLFAPFRANLLTEADLESSDSQLYFAGSDVVLQGEEQRIPITEAIPDLKGQIVLEGESGLGKTMALKQLVRRSRRLVVYLSARKCANGVIEAIRDRLHGPAQDTEFLQSLIYCGAIDICIDGLNEVTPDTRAKITLFAETYFRGNIAMTAQPMDWTPPVNARVYQLQPLTSAQIGDFLRSRQPLLSSTALLQKGQYEQACQAFVTNLSPDDLTQEAMAQTLSNPMELTLVAQMIADDKQPDLLNLQQQQYEVMASRYQHINLNQPFPLDSFAEMAYQMRLAEGFIIPADSWFKELRCMAPYRMVISRQLLDIKGEMVTEWRFRHEKIQDFFIVQTFWGQGNRRPAQHLGDPRFRGVYLLLATQLPFDEALQLREVLIDHAVETKDHTVSDRFIKLIQSRLPN